MIRLLVFSFLISFPAFSTTLKCSRNGTDVYYINGVLTNFTKNVFDKDAIKRLVDSSGKVIDSGPVKNGSQPVNYIGIHNPSFGILNDGAELFAQAYYIKTGKNEDAKAIYNVIRNMPEANLQDKTKYDPGGYFASLARFINPIDLNYNTLKGVAEETELNARKRSMASNDDLQREGEVVVDAVRGYLVLSKSANRKILVVAHSQGNGVINTAIAKINNSQNEIELNEYISKFLGVFNVASPIGSPSNLYKSKNLRTNKDLLIIAAERLGLPAGPVSHDVVQRLTSDYTEHLFYDTYLSPNVFIKPLGANANVPAVKMSEVFVNTLSDLATELEDNCLKPIIKVSSSQFMPVSIDNKFITTGFSGQVVNLKVEDIGADPDMDGIDVGGYDRNETVFTYKVETHYPAKYGVLASVSVVEGVLLESGNIISIPTPYQDLDYRVSIKAVQPSGIEDNYSLSFKVGQNRPLTYALSSTCYKDSRGYNSSGSLGYNILISDDEYKINGRSVFNYTALRQDFYTIRDSAHSVIVEINNSCPVIKPVFHWKTAVVCQKGDLNVCYGSCPPDQDHSIVNTGLQWTHINIYDEQEIFMGRIYLGEANNELGSSYRTFADPNDSTKTISVDIASACGRGGTGPQSFEF